MERINKICKDFNDVLDELNVGFFNEERFDNPFYSNCILRIMENKIAFADIDKLCEYFKFFECYKNFNNISEKNKKEINLFEINNKKQDIYKYIKIIYDEKSFLCTNLMEIEYIGEYVYLSDLLSLKYKYKTTLYDYIINNIDKYKEMKFNYLHKTSLWDELVIYIIDNCSNDKKTISLICYWRNFMNNDTAILIRDKIKEIFEIYDIYKECCLFNNQDNNDLKIYNFIPFEIFLFKTNIDLNFSEYGRYKNSQYINEKEKIMKLIIRYVPNIYHS